MKMRLIFFTIGFILIFNLSGYAATYYVDGSVADDSGSGTAANPKKYIKSGIALMSGGDTLIIKDGVYTGTNNCMNYYSGIPNGAAGNYTTIRAENDFGVIIDGEGVRTPWWIGTSSAQKSYVQHIGLVFRNSNQTNVFLYHYDHVKFIRCASYEAGDANSMGFSSDTASCDYILLEDCFAWGRGRYKFEVSAPHTVLRRCVARYDYHGTEWPQAGISFYTSHSSVAQNCIVIDGIRWQSYSYGFGAANGYYDVTYDGCIAINNEFQGCTWEKQTAGSSVGLMRNCAVWDNLKMGVMVEDNPGDLLTLDRCTIGAVTLDSGTYGYGVGWNNINVINSVIYNCAGSGLREVDASDYNCLYGNPINFDNGANNGMHNYCTENANAVDPIDGIPGNGVSALKYPCRIESDSNLKGTGNGGVDRGANIIKKIGVSGTLYGEPGWNTVTDENLWPFPNEAKIRELMRTYNLHGVNGARGFCADGQTLTKYIWESLGNSMPADIYAGATLTVSTSSLTSGTVSAAYSQTAQATGGTTPYSWTISSGTLPNGLSLNTSTGVISGTPANAGTYSFVIRVSDSASASATQSLSIVIGAADTTAPTISSVTTTGITSNSATVTWTTNEAATSQVEYGTSVSYGSQTTIDSNLVTSHSVVVSGLNANTTYQFRVISKDAANNQTTSANSSFATSGYTDYVSSSAALNLQNFELIPEEGTMTVNIPVNPATAASAQIILTLYDAENPGEGYFYINNNGQTEIPYGVSYDAVSHTFDPISIDKSLLLQGDNAIRFTHIATSGFQVQGVTIRLNFSGTSDTTSPSAVSNLAASTGISDGQVVLSWTAPGDDAASGTATSYDIRYSTAAINDSNWASATQVSGEPAPLVAGTSQTMTVSGLTAGQTYYFAMKTSDEANNVSALSNVPNAQAKQTIVVTDTTAPYTTGHNPEASAINVQPNTPIVLHVKDDGAGVDINTIVMRVNGAVVAPVITGTPADYTLTYTPATDFTQGQTVTVSVEAKDLAP